MNFENLTVWKRSATLSADLYLYFKQLTDFGFKDQIIRSLPDLGGSKRGSGTASSNVRKFRVHSGAMCSKFSDIWAAVPLPQPIHPKSGRLLSLASQSPAT